MHEQMVCTPKLLPRHKWESAAKIATEINPVNHPPVERLVRVVAGFSPISIMCYQIPGSITKDGKPIIGGLDIDRQDFAFAALIYPKVAKPKAVPKPKAKAKSKAKVSRKSKVKHRSRRKR